VIFIDAIHVKIRDGQVANRPIYVALAVTCEGRRDILGLWAGDGGEGAKYRPARRLAGVDRAQRRPPTRCRPTVGSPRRLDGSGCGLSGDSDRAPVQRSSAPSCHRRLPAAVACANPRKLFGREEDYDGDEAR
jgi:hypothetical protein